MFKKIFDKLSRLNSWSKSVLITLISIILALIFHVLGLTHALELKTYDLRFKIRGEIEADSTNIVIVKIDDQTFSSLKQNWPFPRSYYARVVENLHNAGARLIVIDIEFSEPSIKKEDLIFANAISKYSNVIIADKIVYEYGYHGSMNKYLLPPIREIENTGVGQGFANVIHDNDGFIRRYNLFQVNMGRLYFPLSIEVLKYLYEIRNTEIDIEDRKKMTIGQFSIPKYSSNTMLINYFGSSDYFKQYSFSNILDDKNYQLPLNEDTNIFEIHKQEGTFRNKVVFIGATADELRDTEFTPFFDYSNRVKMPGVMMHAHALNTILTERYIKQSSFLFTLVLMSLLAYLAMFLSRFMKPFHGFGVVVGTIVLTAFVSIALFSICHLWIMIVLPILGFIFSYGLNTLDKVLTEQREKGLYRRTFQQYVAPSVVNAMLDSGDFPKFGGERKILTVLFSDIRSFTTFSEKYQPEVVVKYLSSYLSKMVDVIFKYDGTLDKFVGDEIMALFGAPYHFDGHAMRACLTALNMIDELSQLQREWSESNMDYFHIGIGINTGRVIVGNLGSHQLFDYTIIGDEVNLGARLEGANKYYATSIIISEATYNQVKDEAIVRRLDRVRVKGKLIPVNIYELRGMYSIPTIEQDLIIETFEDGRELFEIRQYYQALKRFRLILRYFPSDGPSRLYITRCLDFIQNPPKEDWDGVFNLEK